MKKILLSLIVLACTLSVYAKFVPPINAEVTIKVGQTVQLESYLPLIAGDYVSDCTSFNANIVFAYSSGLVKGMSAGVTEVSIIVSNPNEPIGRIYTIRVTVTNNSGGGTGGIGGGREIVIP